MRPSPEAPRSEELSFGADSGDGPRPSERAAAWARARRRPLTVVGLSVALAAGLGVSGLHLYGKSGRPLSPPDGPWPQTGRLSVFLCRGTDFDAGWETCRAGGAATAADKQKIEAGLRAMPELRDIRFESREETRADLREKSTRGTEPDLIDIPEAYRARVKPGDWTALRHRIEALPGVANVFLFRDGFWWDKADIGISLCPESSSLPTDPCKGRGRPTDDEKRNVLDRIEALPDVEAVYLEDPAHYLKTLRHSYWEETGSAANDVAYLPETFYVRLKRTPARDEVEKIFEGMPGVSDVTDISVFRR